MCNHLDYHDCGYGLKLFTGSIFSLGSDLQGSRCEEFFSGLSGFYPSDSSDFIDFSSFIVYFQVC